MLSQITQDQYHRLHQHHRSFVKEMVHDDIHNLWICGVRVYRQEILDDHQTHVDIQSFEVVDHLRVFDGHQFVDELNVGSES